MKEFAPQASPSAPPVPARSSRRRKERRSAPTVRRQVVAITLRSTAASAMHRSRSLARLGAITAPALSAIKFLVATGVQSAVKAHHHVGFLTARRARLVAIPRRPTRHSARPALHLAASRTRRALAAFACRPLCCLGRLAATRAPALLAMQSLAALGVFTRAVLVVSVTRIAACLAQLDAIQLPPTLPASNAWSDFHGFSTAFSAVCFQAGKYNPSTGQSTCVRGCQLLSPVEFTFLFRFLARLALPTTRKA